MSFAIADRAAAEAWIARLDELGIEHSPVIDASIDDGAPVEVRWDAHLALQGEREHRTTALTGAVTSTLTRPR